MIFNVILGMAAFAMLANPVNFIDYDEIITRHTTAIIEEWDSAKAEESGINYMFARDIGSEDEYKLGYYLCDVNDDGQKELFIGKHSEGDYVASEIFPIFQLYTIKDGAPYLVFSSSDNDRYYLAPENLHFRREGSESGSSDTYWINYELTKDGEMKVIDAYFYDDDPITGDPENPYFHQTTDEFDKDKAGNVTKKEMQKELFKTSKDMIDYESFVKKSRYY